MSVSVRSPSTAKLSFSATLNVFAMTLSGRNAFGSLTRRLMLTFMSDALSVRPPACMMKSSTVSLSAYLYTPGYCTSPRIVSVRSDIFSVLVATKSTSFSFNGMSATRPLIMPSMSTLTTSSVRSAFMRCITAREVIASSVTPSACSMSERTLFTCSPRLYIPGRNTAPFTSTVLA